MSKPTAGKKQNESPESAAQSESVTNSAPEPTKEQAPEEWEMFLEENNDGPIKLIHGSIDFVKKLEATILDWTTTFPTLHIQVLGRVEVPLLDKHHGESVLGLLLKWDGAIRIALPPETIDHLTVVSFGLRYKSFVCNEVALNRLLVNRDSKYTQSLEMRHAMSDSRFLSDLFVKDVTMEVDQLIDASLPGKRQSVAVSAFGSTSAYCDDRHRAGVILSVTLVGKGSLHPQDRLNEMALFHVAFIGNGNDVIYVKRLGDGNGFNNDHLGAIHRYLEHHEGVMHRATIYLATSLDLICPDDDYITHTSITGEKEIYVKQ